MTPFKQSLFAAAVGAALLAAQPALAQNNLGVLYANGEGVPMDRVTAFAWYSVAAARDNTKALYNREQLIKLLSPAQRAQAQHLATEFIRDYSPRVP